MNQWRKCVCSGSPPAEGQGASPLQPFDRPLPQSWLPLPSKPPQAITHGLPLRSLSQQASPLSPFRLLIPSFLSSLCPTSPPLDLFSAALLLLLPPSLSPPPGAVAEIHFKGGLLKDGLTPRFQRASHLCLTARHRLARVSNYGH